MKKPAKNLSKFKPASDNFEFRNFPFYWIMRLGNRYIHKMEVALKKVDMNTTSWRVCMILRENGALSISDITTHAVSRLPTITKTVYNMQEKGLVKIKPRHDDGRVSEVTITGEGLAKVATVLGSTTKLFDQVFDGLTEAQVRNLTSTMEKMFNNLSND